MKHTVCDIFFETLSVKKIYILFWGTLKANDGTAFKHVPAESLTDKKKSEKLREKIEKRKKQREIDSKLKKVSLSFKFRCMSLLYKRNGYSLYICIFKKIF